MRRDYSLNFFYSKVYNLMKVMVKQNGKYDRFFYIKAQNRITKDAAAFLLNDIKKFFCLECKIGVEEKINEFRFECCQYFYNASVLAGCDKIVVPDDHICDCDRNMKFHHCIRIGFENNRRHVFWFQKKSTIFYLYF
jgi:RNase P subunit RPR2